MTNTSDSSRPEISSRDTNIRDFRATRTACVAEVCSLCSQLNKILYFSWRLVKCGCSSFLIQVRGPPCGLHVILPFRRHHCHRCSPGHRTSILCDLPLSTRDLLQFILSHRSRNCLLKRAKCKSFFFSIMLLCRFPPFSGYKFGHVKTAAGSRLSLAWSQALSPAPAEPQPHRSPVFSWLCSSCRLLPTIICCCFTILP